MNDRRSPASGRATSLRDLFGLGRPGAGRIDIHNHKTGHASFSIDTSLNCWRGSLDAGVTASRA